MLAVIANSSRPLLQSAMRNIQEFGNLDSEKRAQADDPNQERSKGHRVKKLLNFISDSFQILGSTESKATNHLKYLWRQLKLGNVPERHRLNKIQLNHSSSKLLTSY